MSCLICAGAGMTGAPCPECGKETPNEGRVVVLAPWPDEMVERLNAHQDDGRRHPYTCPNGHELVAFADGWSCPRCMYTQDWAHD